MILPLRHRNVFKSSNFGATGATPLTADGTTTRGAGLDRFGRAPI